MENESNHIITTLDRANACTMMACDDFEHTVEHSRIISARGLFRNALSRSASFDLAIYQALDEPASVVTRLVRACLLVR
jgi:hypothetical protein